MKAKIADACVQWVLHSPILSNHRIPWSFNPTELIRYIPQSIRSPRWWRDAMWESWCSRGVECLWCGRISRSKENKDRNNWLVVKQHKIWTENRIQADWDWQPVWIATLHKILDRSKTWKTVGVRHNRHVGTGSYMCYRSILHRPINTIITVRCACINSFDWSL